MTAVKTADRVVVSVTATDSGDWQVVSVPTGFQGIAATLFAENDLLHGFVRHEDGEQWEVYDFDGGDASNLLEVTSVSGTVTLSRPAEPYDSSKSDGSRMDAGTGTHTLTLSIGSGSLKRLFREVSPFWKTFTSADASPSVAQYRFFKTNGSTAITRFDDLTEGQRFMVRRGNADIVITHNGTDIDLFGGQNITLTASSSAIEFAVDGGIARQITGSELPANASTTAAIGKILKGYNFYGGTVTGYDAAGDGVIFNATNNAANAPRAWEFRKIASYSGGNINAENAVLQVTHNVGEDCDQVETSFLIQLLNSATKTSDSTGGQNAAMHIRSIKNGNAPTWGAAWEIQDSSGEANPSYGLIGQEMVMAAANTDSGNNRVGFDLVVARPSTNSGSGPVYSGAAGHFGYGIRLTAQVADTAHNAFKTGLKFAGYYDNYCIDTQGSSITSNTAINLGDVQCLQWAGASKVFHNSSAFYYNNGSSNTVMFKDGGDSWFYGSVGLGGSEGEVLSASGYNTLQIKNASSGGLIRLTNGTDYLQAQSTSGGAKLIASGAMIVEAGGAEYLRAQSSMVQLAMPLKLKSYTVATKPSAGLSAGILIYLSDYSTPAQAAYSDGGDWRLVSDPATTVA